MHPTGAPLTPEPFAHVAVPYGSPEEYLAAVLPRVRTALSNGEKVLVTAGRSNLALLRHGLGRDAGAVDSLPVEDWYAHPARMLTACVDYARTHNTVKTLFVGEQPWEGRTCQEIREWIRSESVCNRVLASTPGTGLCLYHRTATPPNVLAAMYRTHPYHLIDSAQRVNKGYVLPELLLLDGDDKPFDDPPTEAEWMEFGLSGLKSVRDFVAALARRAGMELDVISSLVLCVAEISANAIEHGAGYGTIAVWVMNGGLVCEVADPGGGFDRPYPGYLPPEDGSLRGYGLWIARQLCDLLEVRTSEGVSRVRLHMTI